MHTTNPTDAHDRPFVVGESSPLFARGKRCIDMHTTNLRNPKVKRSCLAMACVLTLLLALPTLLSAGESVHYLGAGAEEIAKQLVSCHASSVG